MSPALLLLRGAAGNNDVATGSSTPVDWSKFANDNEERITQEVKRSNEAALIASESKDSIATRQRSLVDPQIYYYNATAATLVSPTAAPSPMPTHSPTAAPSPMPTHLSLKYIGNNWDPAPSFPLGACESDCDTDDDCKGDLICFQRSTNSYTQVPGCLGGDENGGGADYCIRPNAKIVTAPPTSASPTISPVPTATPRIQYVGNDWKPLKRFPLENCSGDCDSNEDCKGDLICFQREAGSFEHVPGCLGGDREGTGTDFCISPDATIITPPPTTAEPTISPKPTPQPTPIPTKNPSGLLDYVVSERLQNLKECMGDCGK